MANPRLSNLACLSIHAERTKALDVQKIIDSFALNHSNRRIVFYHSYKLFALLVAAALCSYEFYY